MKMDHQIDAVHYDPFDDLIVLKVSGEEYLLEMCEDSLLLVANEVGWFAAEKLAEWYLFALQRSLWQGYQH